MVITGARSISAARHHGRRQGSCSRSQLSTSHLKSIARTVAERRGDWRRVSDTVVVVVVVIIVGVLSECKGCEKREKNFGEMHLGKGVCLRCLGLKKAARCAVKEVSGSMAQTNKRRSEVEVTRTGWD